MSSNKLKFYKDIKVIKFCKAKGCGVEYRPARGSFFSHLGVCHKHRRVYYMNWYANIFLPWFKKQTPEVQQKYRDMRYGVWLKWCKKNSGRRRMQALKSYHRRKSDPANKKRKHRRVKLV